jgi:CheY-like chemotaxis protein
VSGGAGAAAGRPAVLVVDDERAVLALLEDVLDELGYGVAAAASAAEALPALAARPDVRAAIVDLTLPDGDGFAALAALRAERPGLPAIVSSGFEVIGPRGPWAEALAAARAAGPTELLPKPYRIEALAAALDRLVPRAS